MSWGRIVILSLHFLVKIGSKNPISGEIKSVLGE